MKRTQLIEWGIITVGLIFGYKFFEGLFSILLRILYNFGQPGLSSDLTRLSVYCGAYAVSFVLLIRKSSQIAIWINGSSQNDIVAVKINKHSLLQVILIGICAATILSKIAEILLYLFETFKNEAGHFHEPIDNTVSKFRFKLAAIEAIVAFVVLYFSKDISSWFIRKNKAEELTFESETEKDI
jgi:hypothetical protein